MEKDILGRNIVNAKTAWALKEMGYKGWVSGYYHENSYEESDDEDALEYYDYECIGPHSGFVNENTIFRAAAPTLVEAFQFLIDHGYRIETWTRLQNKVGIFYISDNNEIKLFFEYTIDEALDKLFVHLFGE